MIERLRAALVIAAAAAFLVPLIPVEADAQVPGGRFRVIIPDVVPADGSNPRFGDRVSGYLRDMIDLDTHVAMPRREIDEHARTFDMRYTDLDCTTARQLATHIAPQSIVMCGTYEDAGGGEFEVDISFFTVPGGEEFGIAPFTRGHEEWVSAAEHLSREFTGLVEQLGTLRTCDEALRNADWDTAIDACERAIEYAPDSYQVRRALAEVYRETGDWEASLEEYEILIEERPQDGEVLEHAGYVAAQAGHQDRARDYYTRYLELNPGNVEIRIRVAFDLGEADPYGAMRLLEEGFEQEPDNVDLHDRYASYSFRAAVALQDEQQFQQQDGDRAVSPEVEELYRQAIESFEVVLEEQGSDARVSAATNSIRAYRQLDDYEGAIRFGQRAMEWFPDEADLHSQLAFAHNEAGDVDAAIAALDRAMEINPDLSQGRMRQGAYLLEADRVDEAVEAFKLAAERGEQSPDQLAQMLFARGWSNYVQQGEYQEGIRIIEASKEFDMSPQMREQADFFHGWSLVQLGEQVQAPGNLQSAQAALPIFRQARELVAAGRGHMDRTGQNAQEILDYIDSFIEIQELIIQREGRRR
jgi:tetratricopeptide (TPR) repeat protein